MADNPRPLNVVGVGASAGGVEALKSFTAELPATLPGAILVVLHMPAAAPSVLSRMLDRHSTLPAITAAEHATSVLGGRLAAIYHRQEAGPA